MNELMITLKNNGFIYYTTNESKAIIAFHEFLQRCDPDINLDNIPFDKAILRDQDGHDIDTWEIVI